MPDAKATRVVMPEQAAEERRRNFQEVTLGLTAEEAVKEAKRCLQCKKPRCVPGCPVEIDIPGFLQEVAAGRFAEAIAVIKRKNALPAVCGRVCPQEVQCEGACVLQAKKQPIAIGAIERFLADYEAQQGEAPATRAPSNGRKVAVVGAGPSGLTVAGDLALLGYEVTVFEAFHAPGGVLIYGIPEFRLPKAIVLREVDYIKRLGVKFELNCVVGRSVTVAELLEEEGFGAAYIATGAGLPSLSGCPGESMVGIYTSNELLTRVNLMKAYQFPRYDTPIEIGRRVGVLGGGNTAMDSARTAMRLGADEVHIIYRRSLDEMPARREEIHHAQQEGIIFDILTNPLEFLGEKGRFKKVRCQKMALGEPDASGRRRPVAVSGSEFEMELDHFVVAIGQGPNPLIPQTTPSLKTEKSGRITIDYNSCRTSIPGVFAGGDIATTHGTVIAAMGDAKRAARAIHGYFEEKQTGTPA